ncbi:prepilin peptidase [bacterium]|nr:prepilin peptidase [bacterium]
MTGHSAIIGFFMFLLGAITGSFTNVLIWRLPRRESIVFPGSHCPVCGKPIKFYDNIPILSYIILGGKCRNCGTKISPRYIFVEAFMGLAFLATYLGYDVLSYIEAIRMLLVLPIFVAITFIDWEHWVIPDELTIAVAAVGIGTAPLMGGWSNIVNSLIGCALGLLTFFLVSILGKKAFRKDALGEGDIYLIAAVGLLVGWTGVLLTIFISALLGTIGGLAIMLFRKSKKKMDNISTIPFGPFIVVATIIVMAEGDKIISAYLSLFK